MTATASTATTSGEPESNPEGAVRARLDVRYGPLPAHRLDLHIPTALDVAVQSGGEGAAQPQPQPGTKLRPLLVYVHGGAWRSEDKAKHAALAARLGRRTGCAVAVPNYRLTSSDPPAVPDDPTYVRHPLHTHDVLRALAFLVGVPFPSDSESERDVDPLPERGTLFDPSRLLLAGHSCGAHILACIFLDSSVSRVSPSLTPPEEVLSAAKALALTEGIYDLDALVQAFPEYQAWFVENTFGAPEGGGAGGKGSGYTRFSATHYPLHRAGAHLRWLVVHSPGDTLVDAGQASGFFAHLSKLYRDAGGDGGGVEKDWTTIMLEHNDMVVTAQYSDLIGGWLVKCVDEEGG